MTIRKPMILYYDNGQPERGRILEKAAVRMGITLFPVIPAHFTQTVGHLAKIKGFPANPSCALQLPPEISQEVMVFCHFTDQKLNEFLGAMKSGILPHVALKAVLTPQNSFWTFHQLFEELYEEHQSFYNQEDPGSEESAF